MPEPVRHFYRRSVGGDPMCSGCAHLVRLHGARGCFCVDPPEEGLAWAFTPDVRGKRCRCLLGPDDFFRLRETRRGVVASPWWVS